MMRAMVASNILSRREGTVLFVPFDPVAYPTGDIVVRTVARLQRFAIARQVYSVTTGNSAALRHQRHPQAPREPVEVASHDAIAAQVSNWPSAF